MRSFRSAYAVVAISVAISLAFVCVTAQAEGDSSATSAGPESTAGDEAPFVPVGLTGSESTGSESTEPNEAASGEAASDGAGLDGAVSDAPTDDDGGISPANVPQSSEADPVDSDDANDEDDEGNGLSVAGFPAVGYTPETHWAFAGLVFLTYPSRDGAEFGSGRIYGVYTTRRQWSLGLQSVHYTRGDRWLIESDLTFSDWIQDFYGVGSSTTRERKFIYNELTFAAEFGMLRRVRELPFRVGFDVKVGWRYQRNFDELLEAEERLAGTERSPIVWAGPRIRWDSRDIEFAPTSGHFFEAAARFSPGSGPGRPGWVATFADYRGFFDLGKTHILAVRGRLEAVSRETPLTNLANTSPLRGPPELRGQNTRSAVAQVEYRTPYVWLISFVAMAGLGAGWGEYGATACCSPHASLGGGLRLALQQERRVNLSADFAWSGYETNFYLGIGETF